MRPDDGPLVAWEPVSPHPMAIARQRMAVTASGSELMRRTTSSDLMRRPRPRRASERGGSTVARQQQAKPSGSDRREGRGPHQDARRWQLGHRAELGPVVAGLEHGVRSQCGAETRGPDSPIVTEATLTRSEDLLDPRG